MPTLSRLLSRFFGWWFGELAACVPAPLREVLHPSRPALLLRAEGNVLRLRLQRLASYQDIGDVALMPGSLDARRSATAQLLRGIPVDRADVVVLIPASQVLRRRLTLPQAAGENLREVLGFELDRHTPFPAEGAAFDCRVVASDKQKQQLTVDLVVAAKLVAEQAKDEAVALGLIATRVDVANPDGFAQGWNLMSPPSDSSGRSVLQWFNLALAAGVCALLVLALWLPLERKQRELAAYEAHLVVVQAVAAEVEALRQSIVATVDRQQFLRRHRDATPMAIGVLDELTRRLPDDSWALQLRLDRRELLLSGFAPAAADLVPLFEESPLFHDVHFAAPVTPDPRVNLERFNLALPFGPQAGIQ